MHSSKNAEVEVMLDQPSEKRAGVRKDVFIKGRQETVDDVIAFIANTVCFGRFWVKMNDGDENTYPFVLQLFIQVADVLSSATYREFDGKFKTGGHEYMAHTLITYLFNIFSLFVTHAKLPKAVRRVKHDNTMDPQCFRMPVMIHKK